jgi:hypothetical protein
MLAPLAPHAQQQMLATLAQFATVEITLILGIIAAVVTWQLLTGRINTTGLFSGPGENVGSNVQLLFVTIAAAGYYLMQVPLCAGPHTMPPVPNQLLILVAGSHGVFTGLRSLPVIGSLIRQEGNAK